MIVALSVRPTLWALVQQEARTGMKAVLRLGSHFTDVSSFQTYLNTHSKALENKGLVVWDDLLVKGSISDALSPARHRPALAGTKIRRRGQGRIAVWLRLADRAGVDHVIVASSDVMGNPLQNVCRKSLYPAIGERMARLAQAFDGYLARVVLTIQAQDSYWTAALAHSVFNGRALPSQADLDKFVTQPRGWRDVIRDVSCALPNTEVLVAPHERFCGHHDAMLEYMCAGQVHAERPYAQLQMPNVPNLMQLRQALDDRGSQADSLPNESGYWHPFDDFQTATLREKYADDWHWLLSGADGTALPIKENGPDMVGFSPLAGSK